MIKLVLIFVCSVVSLAASRPGKYKAIIATKKGMTNIEVRANKIQSSSRVVRQKAEKWIAYKDVSFQSVDDFIKFIDQENAKTSNPKDKLLYLPLMGRALNGVKQNDREIEPTEGALIIGLDVNKVRVGEKIEIDLNPLALWQYNKNRVYEVLSVKRGGDKTVIRFRGVVSGLKVQRVVKDATLEIGRADRRGFRNLVFRENNIYSPSKESVYQGELKD